MVEMLAQAATDEKSFFASAWASNQTPWLRSPNQIDDRKQGVDISELLIGQGTDPAASDKYVVNQATDSDYTDSTLIISGIFFLT